jgi:hypothetical protein
MHATASARQPPRRPVQPSCSGKSVLLMLLSMLAATLLAAATADAATSVHAAAAGPGRQSLAWQQRQLLAPERMYVAPPAHPLIDRAWPGHGSCQLTCMLASTQRLACLRDHMVMGRPLLPASAMMELALAAVVSLLHGSAGPAEGLRCGVADLAIAAPIVLPAAPAADCFVSCGLDVSGGLVISCSQGGWGQQASTVAVTARACAVAASSGSAAPAVSPAGLAALTQAVPQVRQQAQRVAGAAAAVPSMGGAVGRLQPLTAAWHASGYLTSPQQVDSALHLGVLAPGSPAKIPVALGCFLGPAQAAASMPDLGQLHAATTAHAGQAGRVGDTDTSSFYLGAAGGSQDSMSAAARVEQLQTRLVARRAMADDLPAAAAQPAARELRSAAAPLTYALDWLRSEPAVEAGGLLQAGAWLASCPTLCHALEAATAAVAGRAHCTPALHTQAACCTSLRPLPSAADCRSW